MKTIATAAVLMMLAAPAWADETAKNAANADKPIVLSDAEMDGVSAGEYRPQFYLRTDKWTTTTQSNGATTISSGFNCYSCGTSMSAPL